MSTPRTRGSLTGAIGGAGETRAAVSDVAVLDEEDGSSEAPLKVTHEDVKANVPAEPRVIEDAELQRHGLVEQRKTPRSERMRCQCGESFEGETVKDSQALYREHLRKHDPDVPSEDD